MTHVEVEVIIFYRNKEPSTVLALYLAHFYININSVDLFRIVGKPKCGLIGIQGLS